jgi:hypothetical protein
LTRSAKTYRVEAVVDLPAPLFLGSEFLGLLKSATIGGVAVHVVLPDVNESGNETVLHSRALVDWVGSFAEKKQRTIQDGRSAKSMDGETNSSYQLRGF